MILKKVPFEKLKTRNRYYAENTINNINRGYYTIQKKVSLTTVLVKGDDGKLYTRDKNHWVFYKETQKQLFYDTTIDIEEHKSVSYFY